MKLIRFKKFLEEKVPDHYMSDIKFRNYWIDKGVDNFVTLRATYVRPHDIKIDKSERGQGLGTAFMEDLCKFADYNDVQIRLSPSKSLGASSVSRLIKFYKRFGFVENKGKNKNFQFTETMYREPKQ